MARVARRVIERRRMRMLCFMAQHAGEDGLTRASNSQIAQAMGLSVEQVRNACRSLASDGMLESRPQYLYNGAQVENAYALTPLGQQRLVSFLGAGEPVVAKR